MFKQKTHAGFVLKSLHRVLNGHGWACLFNLLFFLQFTFLFVICILFFENGYWQRKLVSAILRGGGGNCVFCLCGTNCREIPTVSERGRAVLRLCCVLSLI